MDCVICGRSDRDRPNINRGEKWCSEMCRKKLKGEISLSQKDIETANPAYLRTAREARAAHLIKTRQKTVGQLTREILLNPVENPVCPECGRGTLVDATEPGNETEVWMCSDPSCANTVLGPWLGEKGDS